MGREELLDIMRFIVRDWVRTGVGGKELGVGGKSEKGPGARFGEETGTRWKAPHPCSFSICNSTGKGNANGETESGL